MIYSRWRVVWMAGDVQGFRTFGLSRKGRLSEDDLFTMSEIIVKKTPGLSCYPIIVQYQKI